MEGFINLLKPKGFTSHDAVLLVRQLLGEPKIGHVGTLDPLAVGALPLLVGSYRKLTEYFQGEDKDYLAEFTFGISTDTDDLQGQVLEKKDASRIEPQDVLKLLPRYLGEITQITPRYSAVKVKGQKLYKLARLGEEVELPRRKVTVYSFNLLSWKEGVYPKAMFFLRVGSGTYVRSLASSLGKALGFGAVLSFLLRTRVGPFLLEDAVTLGAIKEAIRKERVRSLFQKESEILPSERMVDLMPSAIDKVRHGMPLNPGDFRDSEKVMSILSLGQRGDKRRAPFWSLKTGNPIFLANFQEKSYAEPKVVCVLSFKELDKGIPSIVYEKVMI